MQHRCPPHPNRGRRTLRTAQRAAEHAAPRCDSSSSVSYSSTQHSKQHTAHICDMAARATRGRVCTSLMSQHHIIRVASTTLHLPLLHSLPIHRLSPCRRCIEDVQQQPARGCVILVCVDVHHRVGVHASVRLLRDNHLLRRLRQPHARHPHHRRRIRPRTPPRRRRTRQRSAEDPAVDTHAHRGYRRRHSSCCCCRCCCVYIRPRVIRRCLLWLRSVDATPRTAPATAPWRWVARTPRPP